jgi:hypothetical protein
VVTSRLCLGLAALFVAVSACGGDGGEGFGISTSAPAGASVETTAGTVAPTSAATSTSTETSQPSGSTTTSAPEPADTALLDEFLDTDFSEVGPPDEPLTGSDALVGGTPNTTASRSISAALEDAGVDLTGMRFYVLPVTGTAEWLLVIEVGDDTALATDDAAAGEQFLPVVVEQMTLWGLTRLVFNYEGADDAGPLVMTLTMTLADLEAARASEDANIADFAKMQIVRPGS